MSWRVAVRRISGTPTPIDGSAEPVLADGERELARISDTDPNWQNHVAALPSAAPGTVPEPIALRAFPGAAGLVVRMSCSGSPVRFVLGDGTFGPEAPGTDTTVGCDGVVHEHALRIDEWSGAQLAVAAAPDTHWQLLVASEEPPITLAGDEPGWKATGGAGPNFEFGAQADGLSLGAGEKPGPVKIVVSCAGTGVVHVTVDVGAHLGERTESFDAPCSAEGATTGRTFDIKSTTADVTYDHPARAWTAVGILVPDPGSTP